MAEGKAEQDACCAPYCTRPPPITQPQPLLDGAGLLRALRDQAELSSDEAAMAVLQTASDAADAEEKAAADAEVRTHPSP